MNDVLPIITSSSKSNICFTAAAREFSQRFDPYLIIHLFLVHLFISSHPLVSPDLRMPGKIGDGEGAHQSGEQFEAQGEAAGAGGHGIAGG